MLRDDRREIDENDLLGQRETVETMVTALGALPPPACIALYGAWGSGKSTLLHNAMVRVEAKAWLPVWFDPWEHERSGDLLSPLLAALAKKVAESGGDAEKKQTFMDAALGVGKKLGHLAIRAGLAYVGGWIGAALPQPEKAGTTLVGSTQLAMPGSEPATFGEWLKYQDAVNQVKDEFKRLVDAALDAIGAGGVPPKDARVVFFLDDLDRCLPEKVIQLIEGVKLLLCGAPDCKAVFIFALDRLIVGEAIRQQYPGSSAYSGENYLEKIFDLSLETPPVPAEADVVANLRRFIEAQANAFPDGIERLTGPIGGNQLLAEVLSMPAFANPRVIKRTLNRLALLTASQDRREQLRKIANQADYRRFLCWLAGAERFRRLRHFLRAATKADMGLLQQNATGGIRDGGSKPPNDELRSLANAPGFRAFWRQCFPQPSDGIEFSKGNGSLYWFDRLLRSAGL